MTPSKAITTSTHNASLRVVPIIYEYYIAVIHEPKKFPISETLQEYSYPQRHYTSLSYQQFVASLSYQQFITC